MKMQFKIKIIKQSNHFYGGYSTPLEYYKHFYPKMGELLRKELLRRGQKIWELDIV